MIKKVNLQNFTKPELTVRLFAIVRNNPVNLEAGKDALMDLCLKLARENFEYPEKQEESIKVNLALFLLGKPSKFDL